MSKKETREERAWDLLSEITEKLGLIPVDAEFVKEGGEYFLRIFIDRDGGAGVDDCENVSRLLDPELDEENLISDPYTLEVSSPGLNRILKRPRDFIFAKGKEVELLVSVGDIIVTIRQENLEEFVEKTKSILEETLNFGFDVRVGIFTRTQTTVSDNLKVAYGIEEDFDPSLIGLVDPKTNSKETVKLIGD